MSEKRPPAAQRDAAKAPPKPLDPFFHVEDGTGGDWEVSTGMSKKQSRRLERHEERKTMEAAVPDDSQRQRQWHYRARWRSVAHPHQFAQEEQQRLPERALEDQAEEEVASHVEEARSCRVKEQGSVSSHVAEARSCRVKEQGSDGEEVYLEEQQHQADIESKDVAAKQ